MAVTTTKTNKPLNPRGNDQSPKGYNRAELYTGKALDFDGTNDNVEVADNSSLDFTTAMSAFCYMRVDTLSTGGGVDYAISKYDYGNNNRSWLLGQRDNELIAVVSKNGFSGPANTKDRFSVTFKNTSDYYFVGFTFESNVLKLYVNGQEVSTSKANDAEVNSIYSGNADVCVGSGQFNGSGIGFLNGKVANARAFNVALTAAQVADLYNNPEKIVPTGVSNDALKLWLPMQEGAGTTAYDGSGNGNHGTISGATYTHGIGAPVSQTAVIDWNKGRNLLEQTNDIEGSIYWFKSGVTLTADQEDPVGGTDAVKVVTSNATNHQLFNKHTIGTACVLSVYVKTDEPAAYLAAYSNNFAVYFDLANETTSSVVGSGVSGDVETFGDWYRITAYFPAVSVEIQIGFLDAVYSGSSTGPWGISTAVGTTGYVAFPSLTSGTTKSPYIPNLTTSSMSVDVLLPQGLTTGRDITGVNLFENVRKQGALNLDGNSWAEVHDNASVDVSEITAEGWMYAESITGTNNRIVNKWNTNYPERSFQLYGQHATINWMLSDGSSAYSITGGTLNQGEWHHVVGTYDGSTQKIYLNGVQVQSTALSITLKQSSFKVMLGGYATGVYTLNPIAQPRIYNRALTAEEIERNYSAGKNIYK